MQAAERKQISLTELMCQRAKKLAAEERRHQNSEHEGWLEEQITQAFSRHDAGEGEYISNDDMENRMNTTGHAGQAVTVSVEWEKRAQTDRENIFLYLELEAGAVVAIAADGRLAGMAAILIENPLAGVKAGRSESQCKLVMPHFPFIIYIAEKERMRILCVLHTSRKIVGWYSQS